MIQFYFLSILFNALSGYLLSRKDEGEEAVPIFKNETFQLVLGILTMVTGLLKLLSSSPGDLPILGDLFPALTGLVTGFVLVYRFYRNHSTLREEQVTELPPEKTDKLDAFITGYHRPLGFAGMAAAALHFLFPSVLLL